MEWNLFNYEEILNKPKEQKKKYTEKEYREYIIENFKADYTNKVFFNIVLDRYFSGHGWYEQEVEPKEQLVYFKELYSSFTYHFQNDLITIFSLKHKYDNAPDEYSVFAALKGDYIVEFPPIKDLLKEKLCAPACAIWWYNADGTRADFLKYESNTKGQQHYLTFHSEEEKQQWIDFVKNGNEIINPNPKLKEYSFGEWWRDRREYYFFYKMKIHKFGESGRVDSQVKTKRVIDSFTDYEFTLLQMINYFNSLQTSA